MNAFKQSLLGDCGVQESFSVLNLTGIIRNFSQTPVIELSVDVNIYEGGIAFWIISK